MDLLVVGLSYFPTFTELFSAILPQCFGWPEGISVAEQVQRMHEFYSIEEELKYGVVGIHIRLLARRALQ